MTRGVKFGRPPKLNAEQIGLITCLADEGQTAPQYKGAANARAGQALRGSSEFHAWATAISISAATAMTSR